MPTFSPPYPLFFDPPVTQMGGPGIADRPDVPFGSSWFLNLHTAPSAPSAASVLRSFGVQTQPVDLAGRLLTRDSSLSIDTSILVRNQFFFTSGVFASARVEAFFQYFVEEFDPSFRFVRAVTMPGQFVVVREDVWWFSGSDTTAPAFPSAGVTIPNPPGGVLTAHANFFYRIWVDLIADIRGAGFGGLGGSSALCQVGWRIDSIDVGFN